MRIWHAFTGELRNHLDAIFRQSSAFARIVRQQTNFFDAKIAHDRGRQAEVSAVGFKAQRMIGLYRIKAGILQLISLQLRHQTNAAAFLILVNHEPATFFGNSLHGHFQLIATVAAQRTQYLLR